LIIIIYTLTIIIWRADLIWLGAAAKPQRLRPSQIFSTWNFAGRCARKNWWIFFDKKSWENYL